MFFITASTINAQTLSHSNSEYFNTVGDIEWVLAEETSTDITVPPIASDFNLIVKLGSDGSVISEGSYMISITEVTPSEEYTITIDLDLLSSVDLNDEFTLYYENEIGETIIASDIYIFDDEDPEKPTLAPQSASITGMFLTDTYYTTVANLVFDITDVEAVHTIELYEGGSNLESTINSAAGSGDNLSATTLTADGVYVYHVDVIDEAGNTVSSDDINIDYTASATLSVSFSGLTIDNNSESSDASVTKNADVDLKFAGLTVESPEQELVILNSADEEITRISIDETDEYITLPTLDDGAHTITYYFEDIHGNTSTEVDFSFTIDTEAPSILTSTIATGYATNTQLAVTPDGDATTDDATLTFETNEDLAESPTVKINGESPSVNNPSGNNYNATQPDLTLSSYAAIPIEITLKDIAGNTTTITTTTDGSVVYTFPDIVNVIQTSDELQYCDESSKVYFEKDGSISGGDGSYTISWEVNIDDAGYNTIGVVSEEYTENATLSAGSYKYRRVVYSQGIAFPSDPLEIIVEDNAIINTITAPSTVKYFSNSIAINTISIAGNTDPDYSYEWEYSIDGVNWSTIGSATGGSLLYDQEITSAGTHNFRRKVTDAPCESYSNEVTITLYDPIVNSIQNDGDNVYCIGSPEVQLSTKTTVSGGDGNYVYDWLRKEDTGANTYASLGINTEDLSDNSSLTPGTYTYKRTITSDGETFDSDEEIVINVNNPIADNTLTSPSKTIYNGEIAAGTIQFTPGNASGGDNNLKYQWQYYSGSSWTDAVTTADYTHNVIIAENTEVKFRRIVTDNSGDCESISDEITITSLPEIQNTISDGGTNKYCETFSSFEISNSTLSGGNDNYEIKWYREKNSEGAVELTGENNPNYIETGALSAAVYTYTREVTSAGNKVTSAPIVITIDALIENEISIPSTLIYYDEITANTFEIENQKVAGGNASYTYDWERYDATNGWVSTGITSQKFENYNVKIDEVGEYKFRRKITSGECGELYSNEVAINLYESLQNAVEVDGGVLAYCETFSSFELKNKTLSGGNGNYTFKWFRKKGSDAVVELTGENNPNYIETDALTADTYTYTREVTSLGVKLNSSAIIITVDALIENEISTPSTIVVYDEIPANSLVIENQKVAGGGSSYTYDWEIYDGSSWNSTGVTSQRFENYNTKIDKAGEYKFRRKITSGACGELYSNEVTINLYPSVQNTIAVVGGNNICEGYSSFEIETSTLSGGDDSYTYKWYRKIGSGTETLLSGEENENLIVTESLSEGNYTYYREVSSAGQTVKTTGTVVNIQGILKNTITAPSTVVYYDEIPVNTIEIENDKVDGGDNSYSYVWERFDVTNGWQNTGITSQKFENYNVKIDKAGIYKFRRKVTSGACGELYSNEVVINVYLSVQNTIAVNGSSNLCEGYSSFEIETTKLSGGDTTYTYKWYRKIGSASETLLTGETNENLIVTESLSEESYTYYREVSSAGQTVKSSGVVVTIQGEIVNTISAPATDVYYTNIPKNSIVITNDVVDGGNNSYTYDWEIYDGSSWSSSGITTKKFENYNVKINKAGEYKFRRKVTSGACDAIYSNEVAITLYPALSNSSITLQSASEACIGGQIFISGTIPTGGTGSYTYEWFKRDNDDISPSFSSTGITTSIYFDDEITTGEEGDFTFKRVVTSGDINDDALNNTVDVKIYGEPGALTFIPINESSYSNDPSNEVTLDIDEDGYEFYCSGKGVVSNGNGPDNNIFYPSLAGTGNSVITYHIKVGECYYTETTTLIVFDGTQPFSDISNTVCETDDGIDIDMDGPKVAVPDELKTKFTFQQAKLIDEKGNLIKDYGTNPKFTFKASDGLEVGDVGTSKTIKLVAVYLDNLTSSVTNELSQDILLTFEPSAPIIEDGNTFNYCFGPEPIRKLKVMDAIGSIEWREEINGVVLETGNEFDPAIVKDENNDVTKTYYVTQLINGCTSEPTVVTINSYKKTSGPTFKNAGPFNICEGDLMPTFEIASGDEIQWYNSSNELVGSGLSFTSDISTDGIDKIESKTFKVTASDNGCESDKVDIVVNIIPKPSLPEVDGSINNYCAGETNLDDLEVKSDGSATFTWYSDSELKNKIDGFTSTNLEIPDAPATVDGTQTFSYWVVKTINGCDSDPLQISYDVYENPPVPTLVNNKDVFEICSGGSREAIETEGATGTIHWYREQPELQGYEGANKLSTGEDYTPSYDTNVSSDESHTYYVAEESANGCFGPSKMITVTIYALPDEPVLVSTTDDLKVCSADNLPEMEVTGENVQWYTAEDKVNAVHTGTTFTPNVSYAVIADSTVSYFVTSTSSKGCVSTFKEVIVEIKALPELPSVIGTIPSYCIDESIADITVSGESNAIFEWYTSESLAIESRVEDNNATLKIDDKTPEVSELDSVHYWVTQTTPLGCTSLPQKVSIPVYPTPKAPTLSSTELFYCNDDVADPIEATGDFDNITWYLDSNLKNEIIFNKKFTPILSAYSLKNKDVTVTFYATDKNDIGCESSATAVKITIYQETPLIGDKLPDEITYCAGETVQPIVVSEGENLKWYSDEDLTVKVAEGLIFIPSISTDVTEDTSVEYYVTQTINGCEGEPQEIEIEVFALPEGPTFDAIDPLCEGDELQEMTAYGEDGATFTWYSNESLTKMVSDQQTFDPDSLAPAFDEYSTIDFWVIQTSEDKCTSEPTKVSVPVYPTPAPPTLSATDYYYCYGELIEEMEAEGDRITWYDDESLSEDSRVSSISKYRPSFTADESTVDYTLTYFVTQKNENFCESAPQKITITLYKETLLPTLAKTTYSYCAGDALQPISSEGENVQWYSDESLTTKVGEGLIFIPQDDTDVTDDTSIDYYVTQTVNNCESEAQKVEILIYSTPEQPTTTSISPYCEGDVILPLEANGEADATYTWYSNSSLTDVVGTTRIVDLDTLAPSYTEITNMEYWVVQTSKEGCTSEATKVNIPVYPTPSAPTLAATEYFYCYGELIEEMEAEGDRITWYDDESLSEDSRVSSISKYRPSFTPDESTMDYTLTYYVTQKNENFCESAPQKVTITLYQETLIPTLAQTTFEYCAGDALQPISSEGENVIWYSDESLTTKVAEGLIFIPQDATSVTDDTSIDYYVTQTKNDCESAAQKVEIIIYSTPEQPTTTSISPYCSGELIAPIEASGEDGATYKWYSNSSLTEEVGTEKILNLNKNADEVETLSYVDYWVTQTSVEGCTSEATKISIPVYPIPSSPTLDQTNYEYCYGETIDEMTANGARVTWYEDESLTQIVKTGESFRPQFIPEKSTEDYTLTYYVTQKNVNLCESAPEKVTITLYKETLAPTLSQNTFEYCSGAILQPIKVEDGVNIKWYSDSDLTNEVGTGNTYTPQDDTNVTEDITVNYYYTETLNGCESDYQTVNIIVYNTPSAPSIVGDNVINYCSGDIFQPILVLGQSDNLKWYADEDLNTLLSSESEFTPTMENVTTSILSEDYYVTYTRNNCESAATRITVNVNPLPVISLLGITDGEVFCKTDASPVVQALPSNGTLTSSTGVVIRNNQEILLANSPLGNHTLNYTVTNENNCVDSLLISFTIVDAPKVNFSETILCDSKEVTFFDETIISEDDNLTEILEWRYNFGDNEGGITLYSAEEAAQYTHTYSETGFHDVTLTVITNQNCSEISYEKTIFINSPPQVSFDWSVSEFGSEMIFEEHLVIVDKDSIEYRYWDFGDGTSSTSINPKHQYTEVGSYTVTYEVKTKKGCSNILQQEVYVLPHPVLLTENDSYFQNFDLGDGNWKATSHNTNISWEYGIPVTTNFSSTNNAWVTNLDSTYFENEESFLNLPSFDISGLTKPMLSFDMKIDIENGIDGAILQYSLDSGQTWYLLGDMDDPIYWYNSQSILADPGDQIYGTNTLSKGWTGTNTTFGSEDGEYISVRHQLDDFIGEQHLRLRFAFKSNSAQEYEGLVIDNFFIGNRQKVVLIESMTNAAQEASNRAMSSLGDYLATMESDVLSVNYHIYLEGFSDDLNKDNQEASSGRKFFYGVTNAPRTIVDGNTFQEHTDDFLADFENLVYKRTLLDPEFSIDLNLDAISSTGQIGVTLTSHGTFDASDSEILLHIVTIEKSITGIEITNDISEHLNVMKSMSPAPGAEGTSFFGRSWNVGSSETVFVDWANTSVYDTENVELVVFVQDNVSKEIFQAMSYQIDPDLLSSGPINSTDLATELEWNVYPNPSSSRIQVSTTEFIKDGNWEISNINGQKVKEGTFSGNRYSVDVENLASGVYLIRNMKDGKYLPQTLRFVVSK
ncbi:PKD domain-containing protein [Flammeovirga sp. SJP92]|uniref:Ig-like domain-containing protein n=1 Tax=Flammeovirga sp. SJP92 TaxID=1775430 RepID=UPI0007887FCE|nr:PKD domain-containing protein [Flammeovirga sp. SJP92]KXX72175.1 hypothetical protein AVL50_00835 [Flammeovirga sp. SJP92]